MSLVKASLEYVFDASAPRPRRCEALLDLEGLLPPELPLRQGLLCGCLPGRRRPPPPGVAHAMCCRSAPRDQRRIAAKRQGGAVWQCVFFARVLRVLPQFLVLLLFFC